MADINISERQAGDVTILDLNGKVTIGEGSVALRNAIRRLLGRRQKQDPVEPWRRRLYRFKRHRRARFQLHGR